MLILANLSIPNHSFKTQHTLNWTHLIYADSVCVLLDNHTCFTCPNIPSCPVETSDVRRSENGASLQFTYS